MLLWVLLAAICIWALPASKLLFVSLILLWALLFGILLKKNRHKLAFFLLFFLVIFSTWCLIQTPAIQNWLVGKATNILSAELKTRVEVKHVNFNLFNKLLIEGILVEDRKKDTLLYAGKLKINITDWFFFKEKPVIKYIGLSDALIHVNRSDSVWNYQFLLDFFSGPKKSSGKKSQFEIDLKVIDLTNISFNHIDQWIGQDMKGSLKKLYLTARDIDLSKKQIAIKQIDLTDPVFGLYDYTGNKPKITKPAKTKIEIINPELLQWNANNWQVSVDKINLSGGSFINERETTGKPYTDRFDGEHFQFAQIRGQLKNLLFSKDTLTVQLDLATKEKNGFEVKQLQANMKFTPTIMEFNNLEILTDKSKLGNYYAMQYDNFNADMSNFISRVKLTGNFTDSKIHSDDIAFFAPELKPWNKLIYFNGTATGRIDNLTASKFKLTFNNSVINGDISLKGLPDINSTFIDFKSSGSQTNYNDLYTIIPALKRTGAKQLQRLGNIRFKGNYTGFINDFVAYGNFNTGIGNLYADVNMKLPEKGKANYSGKISSTGLNLGQLLNEKSLGLISLNGTIIGKGLTQDELEANFNGNIQQLSFSGYNYKNITLNGKFVKSLFTGQLEINDPNLTVHNLLGSIHFLKDSTQFNLTADLQHANLQQLDITKAPLQVSGKLDLNFTGNQIDNFYGAAKLSNATLKHDSSRLSFDFLTLTSSMLNNKKTLTLETNELEGNITGNFKILDLPQAFNIFLNRYYPSYFKNPKNNLADQDFSFLIKTKSVNEYVQLFDKRLGGFDNAVFSGNLKLAEQAFNFNASVPELIYDGKRFENISVQGNGNHDSLHAVVSVKEIAISDSLHFPNTNLTFSSANDISHIRLLTSASKTLSNAELNAQLTTFEDGVKINFSPSSFILNEKKWDLAKGGEITLRKSLIEANKVIFKEGLQEITIETELNQLTNQPNLVANLKKVQINDFTQLFLKEPRLEGIVTGKLTLKDPFGNPVIDFDATADQFRLDNKEIGSVSIKGDVNTQTGLITAKASASNELNSFNIDGSFNYKDSSANQMAIALTAEKFDISILDNYMGGIFSNMKGNVNTRDLKLYGGPNHRYITGNVQVTEAELKVIYTQVTYKFNNKTIIFNPDEIDFGLLQLTDTLNNTGTASGKIKHRFFDDFEFDNIKFETGKMLLLNTTKKDNSQFYGHVVGKARMTLNGPLSDMRMHISGEPSAVDSSHIYIPTSSGSQEYGKIDYIDFIQYGSKMKDILSAKKEANFLVSMDLKANPACKIDVILDEVTGDIIKGRGDGVLNITVGSIEPLSIRGKYNITDGEYKFNFQTFLQKYFNINQGSSITWNGDPYEAQINVKAEYLAPNVDLSSLATSKGRYQQKSDLLIIAHLTNTLKAPKIAFEFEIPKNKQTDFSNDPVLLENLKKFAKDENEQNRQVASLLLFNSFINDNNGGFGASTASFISGTAGQVISGFLNNQLTKVFQKIFKDPTLTPYISFNSNYNLSSPEIINALQASSNFGFTKTYIDGRLVVTLGGNIDYNNPYILQTKNTNVLLTPDITIEYILTKDGKLRIVGFNRTVVDATLGQRNRTGLRLSYSKDFDKLTRAERIALREERKKKKNKSLSPLPE